MKQSFFEAGVNSKAIIEELAAGTQIFIPPDVRLFPATSKPQPDDDTPAKDSVARIIKFKYWGTE
jgi:hypothetical protein